MTATTRPTEETSAHLAARPADLHDPAYQAFWLLRIGFVVAPIVFGLDKFFHVLVDWDRYLAPEFVDLFNTEAHTLMYAVGAIDIPGSSSPSVHGSADTSSRPGWPASSSTS
jgi:hypothetical protein